MVLMVVCGLLLLLGVVSVVVWGDGTVSEPQLDDGEGRGSAALAARRYIWYLTVAVVSGVGAGRLAAGAGGRLIMRLLAATAGDAAQGQETEADEIVGRISTGGTVSFIVFAALLVGLATGVLYMLVRRWLPDGRLGGLVYGALLLVLGATRYEPLRADNPRLRHRRARLGGRDGVRHTGAAARDAGRRPRRALQRSTSRRLQPVLAARLHPAARLAARVSRLWSVRDRRRTGRRAQAPAQVSGCIRAISQGPYRRTPDPGGHQPGGASWVHFRGHRHRGSPTVGGKQASRARLSRRSEWTRSRRLECCRRRLRNRAKESAVVARERVLLLVRFRPHRRVP